LADRKLLIGLLVICLAVGCRAQTSTQGLFDPATQRRIEVLIRAQFSVSPDVNVILGPRTPSKFTGYDNLAITFTKGSNSQKADYLISTDNQTLVHMNSVSIANDPVFSINIAGRPVRGNPDAKVTAVNFDDLECGYCARMHAQLFPDTLNHYKDLVRFVYKDSPLAEIHPWAVHASVDANCLADQSGPTYWAFVDYIHGHESEVTGSDRDAKKSFDALDRIARNEAILAKLDQGRLDQCLAKQDETKVNASRAEADALGVDGTPAIFVNGEKVNGLVAKEQLWMVIDRALKAAGEQPPPPSAPTPQNSQNSGKGQ
jgi:protein-disulfide isomerase